MGPKVKIVPKRPQLMRIDTTVDSGIPEAPKVWWVPNHGQTSDPRPGDGWGYVGTGHGYERTDYYTATANGLAWTHIPYAPEPSESDGKASEQKKKEEKNPKAAMIRKPDIQVVRTPITPAAPASAAATDADADLGD